VVVLLPFLFILVPKHEQDKPTCFKKKFIKENISIYYLLFDKIKVVGRKIGHHYI